MNEESELEFRAQYLGEFWEPKNLSVLYDATYKYVKKTEQMDEWYGYFAPEYNTYIPKPEFRADCLKFARDELAKFADFTIRYGFNNGEVKRALRWAQNEYEINRFGWKSKR